MPKLTAPPLPPGPRKTLSDELHRLHLRAGWPSVRDMTRAIGGTSVASSSRVHDVFRQPRLPDWALLDILVTALADGIRGLDSSAESQRFHGLWAAAAEASTATETPDSSPSSPADPERQASPVPDADRSSSSSVSPKTSLAAAAAEGLTSEQIGGLLGTERVLGATFPPMRSMGDYGKTPEPVDQESFKFHQGGSVVDDSFNRSGPEIAAELSRMRYEGISRQEMEHTFYGTIKSLRRLVAMERTQVQIAQNSARILPHLAEGRIAVLDGWEDSIRMVERRFEALEREGDKDMMHRLLTVTVAHLAKKMGELEEWPTDPLHG
ncbi:hypothetical protein [Streptomyces sp. NPDC058757]|uniref:hypothetical protein n=1 Tax=unclassified Streptomyces TaxID=2593676 RepID=UPI0036AB8728